MQALDTFLAVTIVGAILAGGFWLYRFHDCYFKKKMTRRHSIEEADEDAVTAIAFYAASAIVSFFVTLAVMG